MNPPKLRELPARGMLGRPLPSTAGGPRSACLTPNKGGRAPPTARLYTPKPSLGLYRPEPSAAT